MLVYFTYCHVTVNDTLLQDEIDEIWKAAVTDDIDTLYGLMQSNVNVTDAYITGVSILYVVTEV